MSAGGQFGGSRGVPSKAPEKGIFPLDHFGECKEVAKAYTACLKQSKGDAGVCRELSKKYFECRMSSGLMEKQELAELGFYGRETEEAPVRTDSASGQKGYRGFVAGTMRARRGKLNEEEDR
ncbi:unnamed protein product [Pedinophyceae sp. YPF-701]|nr:unnamed protein product [Pedinophyceae sp. YPF-701]